MKLTLKNVKITFPAIFEARTDIFGNTKYRANFLFNKGSQTHLDLQKAIKAAATEKFGAKADSALRSIMAADRTPIHDGDAKDYAGYATRMYLSASNKVAPKVVDRDPTVGITEADGKIYGGAVVNAVIDVWADVKNNRVNATLLGVQFVEEGERLSGAPAVAAESDFEVLEDPLFG